MEILFEKRKNQNEKWIKSTQIKSNQIGIGNGNVEGVKKEDRVSIETGKWSPEDKGGNPRERKEENQR